MELFLFLAIPLCIGVFHGVASSDLDEFRQFQSKYGKHYATESEEQLRFEIYKSNRELIESYNSNPTFTFQLTLNKFADLTLDEFHDRFVSQSLVEPDSFLELEQAQVGAVPDYVDWALIGAIGLRDQAQCRSNYALVSSAAIQSSWAIRYHELIPLSVQQMMDCTRPAATLGCVQGDVRTGLRYAMDGPGLCSAESYPYTGRVSESCHADHCQALAKIKSFQDLVPNNERHLQMAVFAQPVISYISIADPGIMFYSSGIYNGPCAGTATHAVVIVGYGNDTNTGELYWKVGNTWGNRWGERGYIRMTRSTRDDSPGICAIASAPIYIQTY